MLNLFIRSTLPFVLIWGMILDARGGEPPLPTFRNSIDLELVELPSGLFVRGGDQNDPDANEDEFPAREISILRPFSIGKYEVTQGQFERVMRQNPCWFGPNGAGRVLIGDQETSRWPVDNASWKDANDFCRQLSELPAEKSAGRRYRLPTEIEWEYACRAGTATRFSFGKQLTSDQAWFGQLDPAAHPLDVGSFPPNAWGLHDLHGNVWEWCQNRYLPDAYAHGNSEENDEQIVGSTARVVRGGDWRSTAAFCRSSNRDLTRESRRDIGNGFRVICEISFR